jgi:hypothetical protein
MAIIVIFSVLGGTAGGIIGFNNAGIGGSILGIIIGALAGGYGIAGVIMASLWLWDNFVPIAVAIGIAATFILIIFMIVRFWGAGIP